MSECLKFCTRIEIESRFSLKMSVCGHELPPSPRQLQHCIHVMPEIAKIPLQITDFFSSRYVVISSQNRSLEFKNKKEHLTKYYI